MAEAMNRRSFFAAIAGVIASAKAKITPTLPLSLDAFRAAYTRPALETLRFGDLDYKIGDTITIRRPSRLNIQERFRVSAIAESQIRAECLGDQIFRAGTHWGGPMPAQRREYIEPSGDIPLVVASGEEDEDFDPWD